MQSDHCGLPEDPFQPAPDPRFYFDSRAHRKAMAYLGYGVAQGEGFIVVTGEEGIGKSILIDRFVEMVDRTRIHVVAVRAVPGDGLEILRLIARHLGLAGDAVDEAHLRDTIERRLDAEARAGRRTLLILDDAGTLGAPALEALAMLSTYRVGGRPLLQIFLVGRLELRDKLDRSEKLEPLRRRLLATHHLTALEEDEIGAYLLHRLRVAGWEGRPAFSPEAFAALHRHGGGLPRRLNQLAARLLLYVSTGQLGAIDGVTVDAALLDVVAEPRARDFSGKVLPLRPLQAVPDFGPGTRIAALEARVDEQEAALRRVMTLFIDWIDGMPDAERRRSSAG